VTGAAQVADRPAVRALAELLKDTARVVAQLAPEEYTDSDVPGISGSIGGHVRHCLDHVRALELGIDRGLVDYDARRRDVGIESEREVAVRSLLAAASRLHEVPREALSRMVVVRGPVSSLSSSAIPFTTTRRSRCSRIVSARAGCRTDSALRRARRRWPERRDVYRQYRALG